ncbi:MAG: hydantoinase B/oxoprolinase family protein, partial [Verrucomicrobiota bacterium]
MNRSSSDRQFYSNLFGSLAEEMGVTLARTAYSPNIKERRDFSCALYDGDGRMIAQAAHIPVHLGAMPLSVEAVRRTFKRMAEGDVFIVNDPFQGGTHLPDITLVRPVLLERRVVAFLANRAHHADVG